MLAHHIKEVLTLLPEALPMVKSASLEGDFPVDSKDSVAASYLTAHYLIKVAGRRVDNTRLTMLEKAAHLHGIKDELDRMLPRLVPMEKQASEQEVLSMVKSAEAMFEGNLCGFLSIEKAAAEASTLMEKYASSVTSQEVKRYAGVAYLDKSAAVQALGNRFYATKQQGTDFIKVARIIMDQVREDDFATIKQVCETVTTLDKKAGLDVIGFNFYKEALITKQAAFEDALTVRIADTDVPYSKVRKLGNERIGSFLGTDIASALTGIAANDKAVLQSLPRDSQIILKNMLKNV